MAMTDDEQRQLDIIGYNLSRLLKQNGATQRELASAIGVSESAVGKWVLAKNAPTMGSVQKMANYFGVRMSDILERKSPNTNDISEHIKRTVATMRQMTASGQARVADYADDLHASGKYDRWRRKEYGRAGFYPLERTNRMDYEEAMERQAEGTK